MFLHGTSKINDQGHLEIGGCDTSDLKAQYGTPLYIVDEQSVRNRCREYIEAFNASGLKFQVAYASKAFCVMAMCRLADEEGMSLDVVSDGELYTALQAGFPAERIHFHGNNKTPEEIEMALDAHIGCFVVDNVIELHMLQAIAAEKNRTVNILLRVTPGVEAHTHEYISTGQTDSKFGFDIGNGSAYEAVKLAEAQGNINLMGIHSHIGSQIFEVEGFQMAVQRVAEFASSVKEGLGVVFKVVNLGGGFGIRYVDGDTPLQVSQYVKAITDAVKTHFAGLGSELPEIWVEPGRSIVGDAGTTLYTVGTSKDIPGVRKYVAVDGGMTDNPRPALYESKYEAVLANRANDKVEETVSIAGKCCESGDMLIWDLDLPKVETGDLLAVSCTGAYNYSMASNYNRIRKPAVVFVKDGQSNLVVRRESLADIISNDIVPANVAKETVTS
ncbi:diaminopimelate decarboxylase [Paenibacillus vortex V453]|jgi:diaminopimelate decarboxylase|uniref:Diaminopimelate decarboxylase n=3 Tax=Paenibacillus TaxID=44249 RepID=A0A163LDR6_9BACL|nr:MULTISPECIES: diaminopimelate decarboxylase [Paenibacillus]ANA81989.1 diaminopimelate decarboxylase [Paenibacillus glucanolyticus]AVV59275.1 diaminopimelate decarboxylase [Paenibacillus glucanolyticus]EFU41335.1 diaminopimelate decarboxylase [Paenibacillus vortex V453]ETT43422.1 diaminopimelate decarboxylase [Paenibacillus sp. FSL R5-808]KZS48030.1 diaminopimelate decarboxylase [Paenibacillus glucanolyticus]